MNQKENARQASACWLRYGKLTQDTVIAAYNRWSRRIVMTEKLPRILTAAEELSEGIQGMLGWMPERMVSTEAAGGECIVLCTLNEAARVGGLVAGSAPLALEEEGFLIKRLDALPSAEETGGGMLVAGKTDRGVLYGVFRLLQMMQRGEDLSELFLLENPAGTLRMLNQWDNMDGTIERGYAGRSIFYDDNRIRKDKSGIRQYARLLASTGINGIVINNVNVRGKAGELLTAGLLPEVAEIADIFGKYGIRVFMSINFASPMRLGGLDTADPESPAVRTWWNTKAEELYRFIPEFGGFLVKADSEFNPGPYAYNRTHAQGANMLAQALAPHGGLVIWRCFVYNCLQDWRDRKTDRARAAYDNFMPLDGAFADNVVLQIKNGPMDFQVREPVSPLLGAMKHTNQIVEFQVTQEYTGQQKHLCYLVPQWKRVLSFDTHAKGPGSTVGKVVDGTLYQRNNNGFAAVSNIGDDDNWTGHPLAQANLYGFGRLAWNPDLKAEDIAREWIALTFAHHESVMEPVLEMLMSSWPVYEAYTVPLGIGWMVNPNHHYGPNVDGYEYDKWGTYHRADLHGIGVDRTRQIGTGYTGQYFEPNATQFESLTDCPEELLLFFHHVAYTHRLRSGKTLIQHIYDTHFEGVEAVERMLDTWSSLEGLMDPVIHRNALARFQTQVVDAAEWRDVINTYFYRKTGIPDEKGRKIY